MLKKRKLNIQLVDTFKSLKIAANATNTAYVLGTGTEVFEGEPDIMWQTTCYIKDTGLIWNGGSFYNTLKDLDLNTIITEDKLQTAINLITTLIETYKKNLALFNKLVLTLLNENGYNITIDNPYYVDLNDAELMLFLLENNYDSDGLGISLADLDNITTFDEKLVGNTSIENINLNNFTNLNDIDLRNTTISCEFGSETT